ncbi:hypothetical protein N0V93_007058 [Gnomoniopsis smithogilvyi]|uniref:Heterokaryon incompatibility domain-containing protein n=1 Tax=Gnomoniopsis smithogilvyi TaxID=1191159 RepID=A0A9W9CWA6_9PEZI|nr:hypothetical protein N0V93_007058 [Gnomoniopsis smithogilvyi]
MHQSSGPHEYDSLDSPQAFRLLRLHDAPSFDDPIECAIETHELDGESHPCYTALSYTWGSSSRTEAIHLPASKAHINVTPILAQALRYLRRLQSTHPDLKSNWWWIDMLCINQDSLPERTAQVSLMRTIFQTASLTAVWLGPAEDNSDTLMFHLTDSTPSDRRVWTSSPEGNSAIKAFQDRPYWRRTWIIQEVCVSPNVMLLCGDKVAPWKAFEAQHKWLRQRSFPESHDVPDLRVLRNKFQRNELHLGFLVYRAKAAQCANPRDSVFGLLGLVTGGLGLKVVPNYKLSPCAVFSTAIRVARADLEESGLRDALIRGRRKPRGAYGFRKKLLAVMEEIQDHLHEPLSEDDSIRTDCDGFQCGMWDLCWRFCGIALQLE